MLGENLRNLEYAKGSRHFEDEINQNAILEDLDQELLNAYKKRIGAEGIDTYHVLTARRFLQKIDAAKAFIADQLRVFTRQEHGSGWFVEKPEYPKFPWVGGIINAVAHRDYAALGQFIKVSMYDDRLEIESPGRFPYIVTADNISDTRFSRNKTISRVMTEFE